MWMNLPKNRGESDKELEMGTTSKIKLEEREGIRRSGHWNCNAKGCSKLLEKKNDWEQSSLKDFLGQGNKSLWDDFVLTELETKHAKLDCKLFKWEAVTGKEVCVLVLACSSFNPGSLQVMMSSNHCVYQVFYVN